MVSELCLNFSISWMPYHLNVQLIMLRDVEQRPTQKHARTVCHAHTATTTPTTLATWKAMDGSRSSRPAVALGYYPQMDTAAVGVATPAPMENLPRTWATAQGMAYGRHPSSARTACLANQVLSLSPLLDYLIPRQKLHIHKKKMARKQVTRTTSPATGPPSTTTHAWNAPIAKMGTTSSRLGIRRPRGWNATARFVNVRYFCFYSSSKSECCKPKPCTLS
jgi:hypothetical protein